MTARFLQYQFAATGDATAVPMGTQGDGSVSYQQGYGPKYELPKTDANAKNIERDKQNSLFGDITGALMQYQRTGTPEWATAADNGGTAYAYAKGARVLYTNGLVYVSTAAANTTTPGAGGAAWVPDAPFRIPRVQGFTTSGTYTPSPGLLFLLVEIVGGGGGGGGSVGAASSGAAGGGGGGGAYSRQLFTAAQVGTAAIAVTVGAGGVGGNPGLNSGNTGGATTFLTLTANGGAGGAASSASSQVTSNATGGIGGSSGGGLLNVPGAGGGPGLILGANGGLSGAGGATIFGSGGVPAYPTGNGGNPGLGFGAGGSGGSSNTTSFAGGNGAGGLVLLTEYCAH